MRVMMLYRPFSPDAEAGAMPKPEDFARMNVFIEEQTRSGALLETGGLKPSSQGTRIRLEGGRYQVVDGPFAEAKEVVGGYALMQFGSKEEAVAAAKRFLEVAGDGECEMRLLYEEADFAGLAASLAGERAAHR